MEDVFLPGVQALPFRAVSRGHSRGCFRRFSVVSACFYVKNR